MIGTDLDALRTAVDSAVDTGAAAAAWAALTEAWLGNRRLAEHTRAGYRRDVADFLAWCATNGLNPQAARFTHLNAYARHLENAGGEPGRRGYAPATVARRLSAVSSWYDFLVRLDVAARNPVDGTDRPAVDRHHSATVGLTVEQVDALLAAVDRPRPGSDTRDRDRAVLTLLADLGLRVSEVCGLDVADLGHDRDHRTLHFTGKGGRVHRRSLDAGTARALDRYLATRAAAAGVDVDQLAGALFVTDTGRRIDRHAMYALVRSTARRAGLPHADQISPHSLRHAFVTAAREAGAALEDVQDALRHADPRTTRRYDRDRHNLDRDPSHAVWQLRAGRRT